MTLDSHWGPFSPVTIDDPQVHALRRVGVLDVGSNSVRLVIFDGAARSPAYFYNEKVMCGLGIGGIETGLLNPEGKTRALAAIKRFAVLANDMGAPLHAVATAAIREARDGAEFCQTVFETTGVTIHIIDGNEEARLTAQGVLLGWPGSYGMVCDMGGSSMELADIQNGEVGNRLTSALGPLKLQGFSSHKKLKAYVKDVIADLHRDMKNETGMRLFLVGGSWRAIARIDMERRAYPMTVLHEYRMTAQQIRTTSDYIFSANLKDLQKRCDISGARMSLIPQAIVVLREMIKCFKPKDITVSSYGIREGLLYEQMPPALRHADPLIEACRYAEAKDARHPGFGSVLFNFVKPLFPKADWQKQRIIKAACLLHDVSWRAHPDYRDEVAFDNATRANLGGLKHPERIYLGIALYHRYSGSIKDSRFADLLSNLPDDDLKEAKVLGKAMRLGAMLWHKTDRHTGRLEWIKRKRQLILHLNPQTAVLWGEVAAARFESLAQEMGADHHEMTFKGPEPVSDPEKDTVIAS